MPLKPPGWHFKKRTLWVPVPASLFSLLKIALLSLLKDIKGSGSLLSLRVGKKKSKCCVSPTDPQHKGAVCKTHQQGQGSEGAPPRGERADEPHFPSLLLAPSVDLAGAGSQTLLADSSAARKCFLVRPPRLSCSAQQWSDFADWHAESGWHFPSFPNLPQPNGPDTFGS